MKRITYLTIGLLTLSGALFNAAYADGNDKKAVKIPEAMREALGRFNVHSVKPSVVKGVHEAIVDNNEIIYISDDGRYVLTGSIIDIQKEMNVTQQTIENLRKEHFEALAKADYLSYKPSEGFLGKFKKAKYHINVFTDVDCGYCRKLHREMKDYHDKGIEVRYFFFPRAGRNSASAQKLESIWCAKDRQDAMDKAKNNQSIPQKTCDNPIDKHIELARSLGLEGTPLIYTQHGRRIGGYRPAQAIYDVLKADELKQSQ